MISAVVVSYRSGDLAAHAIAALRDDAARSGRLLEAVAVVNSQDPEEVRLLSGSADRTIDAGENLGYAGGLNRGIAAARGDVLFLMNPDVTVRPGAVAALAAAVRSAPLTMAGPATFLDEDESLLIPIFDEPTPLDLARRRLLLHPGGAARVFSRRLRRVLRTVEAVSRRETFTVSALPGALMAVTRRTLETVGPFDEGYRLYYEENDWQRRLRLGGGRLLLVGAARAVHPYGRTTGREPSAAAWFAESERRYFTKHFGARGAMALDALADASASVPATPEPPERDTLSWTGEAIGVAVSPLRSFGVFAWAGMAAGASAWRPPDDFLEMARGAAWYARAVVRSTRPGLAEATLSS
jgi:GT2 family glycosyltransferase